MEKNFKIVKSHKNLKIVLEKDHSRLYQLSAKHQASFIDSQFFGKAN
mgnify:CR=1 FL=1